MEEDYIVLDIVDVLHLINDKSDDIKDKLQSSIHSVNSLNVGEVQLSILSFFNEIHKFVEGTPSEPLVGNKLLAYMKEDKSFHIPTFGKIKTKKVYREQLKNV